MTRPSGPHEGCAASARALAVLSSHRSTVAHGLTSGAPPHCGLACLASVPRPTCARRRARRNEKVAAEKDAAASAHAEELVQLNQKLAAHDQEVSQLKSAAAADVQSKSQRITELEGEMESVNTVALQT